MTLNALLPARALRTTALAVTGALVLSGALAASALQASPASAAVLGAPVVSPTTGTNETLFGGSLANAQCPAGTDSAFWSMEGGDLTPDTYAAFLGDSTNATGTGAQEFSGASVANIKTVTGQMTTAGTYRVEFHCFAGPTKTDSYQLAFAYDPAGVGSWTATAAPVATVPEAPGPPAATAPTTGASATLTWSAPASDGGASVTGYKVEVTRNGAVEPTLVDATSSPTTIAGLTNGSTYSFRVAAVNSVGTGAFSAASNGVIPRVATKVVITSAPAKVTYGVAMKVVGKLTLANGTTAVAGQSVAMQVKKRGTSTWSTKAYATSSSTGTVTYSAYKPTFAIDVRLVKSTAGSYLGAVSTAKSATIQRRITTAWSARTIYLGKTSTLSGYVYPRSSGRTVILQRKSGTSWVSVTSKVLPSTTAGYSKYAFVVKPGSKGYKYYRVVIGAAGGFVTSVGNAPALKVV